MDIKHIQTLLPFYQVMYEIPAIADATFTMWFDAPVVIRGILGFLLRYILAQVTGWWVTRKRDPLVDAPELTWFITTRDLPGPLLHTLASGLRNTSYPNLRVVVLSCGSEQPVARVIDRLSDNRLAVEHAHRTQPEWYQWISRNVTTDYFIVTHDDMHFVGGDWVVEIIRPMLDNKAVGCVCGEAFPIRLNTIEPSGERVDITFGLSTWMWATKREAIQGSRGDFSFTKRGVSASGRLEVWDQGGLWLTELKDAGWDIAVQSARDAHLWHHFENFDWTRNAGEQRYARLKQWQRRLVTLLATVEWVRYLISRRFR